MISQRSRGCSICFLSHVLRVVLETSSTVAVIRIEKKQQHVFFFIIIMLHFLVIIAGLVIVNQIFFVTKRPNDKNNIAKNLIAYCVVQNGS